MEFHRRWCIIEGSLRNRKWTTMTPEAWTALGTGDVIPIASTATFVGARSRTVQHRPDQADEMREGEDAPSTHEPPALNTAVR